MKRMLNFLWSKNNLDTLSWKRILELNDTIVWRIRRHEFEVAKIEEIKKMVQLRPIHKFKKFYNYYYYQIHVYKIE